MPQPTDAATLRALYAPINYRNIHGGEISTGNVTLAPVDDPQSRRIVSLDQVKFDEPAAGGGVVSLDAVKFDQDPAEETGVMKAAGLGLGAGITGIAKSVGTGMQWAGERLGIDSLKGAGKTTEDYWDKFGKQFEAPKDLQGAIVDDPGLLKKGAWWAYNTMQAAPSFAASIIPGVGAARTISVAGKAMAFTPQLVAKLAAIGGAVAGGATGGALEGAGTFQEIKAKGGTDAEAAMGAELMTLASGGLNAISVGKIMSPGVSGKIAHILKSAGVESITE
jgi:hypothetical protein